MEQLQPYTQTRLLNEELKNPHLVETLIRVAPSTGKRIQSANPTTDNLTTIFNQKMKGEIPEFDINFNVQGIPLVLTKQSYLELRLTPQFQQELQLGSTYLSPPLTFEFNRALWPKVNVACVTSASATFSNFGIESPNPLLLPYIKYFQMNEDLRTSYSRAWNPSYISNTLGSVYTYANRYLNNAGNGAFSNPIHRSPYEVSAIRDPGRQNTYSWYGQPLLIQIPLEDLLPVFQIPVMPLRQTNTSNINIRLRLRSPQHMFFSTMFFNPSTGASFMREGAGNDMPFQDFRAYVEEHMSLYGGDDLRGRRVSLENSIIGGGTLKWLRALTFLPFGTYTSDLSFYVDFDVDVELVLRALTTPLLNPLAQRYIEPFIDEQNQFVAHFTDYYTFSQTLLCNLKANTRFVFTPSQLFYNTTHVVMFFMQDIGNAYNQAVSLPTSLSGSVDVGTMKSLFNHGHFVLRENIDIKQFQISLGSSCTPLFDRPLDQAEMLAVTEESMKKYNPSEMYGDVMFIQNRLQEGDAFFFFDLTHARNSGYFIDADNMIRVEGSITRRPKLVQTAIQGDQQAAQAEDQTTIHVIMMLLWQNTFTVLFDLDGAVLFQQQ